MRTLIATLVLLMALSAPAQAEQAYCENVADMAERIMELRQNGASAADVMAIAKGNDLLQAMTVEAYEGGRYRVEANQQREIADFRDEWYLWCFKVRNK
jgi:hypothetical protein